MLEPSGFGLVIFAQGFAFLLVVFINWGMGPTGTRSTAANRTDADALSEVARRARRSARAHDGVGRIAVGALVLVLTMRDHPEFLVLAWVAAAAIALSPNWFFVGLERARVTALIQLSLRGRRGADVRAGRRSATRGSSWRCSPDPRSEAYFVSDVVMYRHVEFRLPEWRLSAGRSETRP